MNELFRVGALALGVWAVSGPAAAESLVLYDNFQATTIDPHRWGDPVNLTDLERSRMLTNNSLRLVQRDWGSTASDAGSSSANWTESLSRSGPVTQLRATVKVAAIDMTACAPNSTPSNVRARVTGSFFNSGNRSAGSMVGDVLAQIWARRNSNSVDAQGVLRVQGWVGICTTSDCSASTQIGPIVDLGTVNVGTNVLLQVDWDRANKQFLFSRDKGATTALAYPVDDSADPGNPYKSVSTSTTVASCASAPRAFGYIDARFDNVAVNASAKP